jgi:aldose 1-epimerase
MPILKPTRLEPSNAARACCYFPMIPFSNRIENSQFQFAGATVTLLENVAGTRHAIHGHGWQATWQVTDRDDTSCSISYRRDASNDWPWRYEGRQSFAIEGNSLRMALAVQNLDARPMPCGLGFHPFFPAPDGARLQLEAKRVWKGSVRDFPRERVAVPAHLSFAGGALLSERIGTDHCFDGWQRLATLKLDHAHHAVVLEGCEATSYVIVYVPGGDLCCVEPVTHAVNAMNLADPATAGLWTLEPTGTREITTTIRIESLG